jgi:hypothetical protein
MPPSASDPTSSAARTGPERPNPLCPRAPGRCVAVAPPARRTGWRRDSTRLAASWRSTPPRRTGTAAAAALGSGSTTSARSSRHRSRSIQPIDGALPRTAGSTRTVPRGGERCVVSLHRPGGALQSWRRFDALAPARRTACSTSASGTKASITWARRGSGGSSGDRQRRAGVSVGMESGPQQGSHAPGGSHRHANVAYELVADRPAGARGVKPVPRPILGLPARRRSAQNSRATAGPARSAAQLRVPPLLPSPPRPAPRARPRLVGRPPSPAVHDLRPRGGPCRSPCR